MMPESLLFSSKNLYTTRKSSKFLTKLPSSSAKPDLNMARSFENLSASRTWDQHQIE